MLQGGAQVGFALHHPPGGTCTAYPTSQQFLEVCVCMPGPLRLFHIAKSCAPVLFMLRVMLLQVDFLVMDQIRSDTLLAVMMYRVVHVCVDLSSMQARQIEPHGRADY